MLFELHNISQRARELAENMENIAFNKCIKLLIVSLFMVVVPLHSNIIFFNILSRQWCLLWFSLCAAEIPQCSRRTTVI